MILLPLLNKQKDYSLSHCTKIYLIVCLHFSKHQISLHCNT